MGSGSLSVWEKFDIEEYKERRTAAVPQSSVRDAESKPADSRWQWMRKRSFWAVLTLIAGIVWIYILLKLFVGDFDRWIVSSVAPSWIWILDYRFFVLLVILTVIIVITKRWMAAAILLYILFFPIVVVFWKIPRLYYRSQSWNLVIGTIQVMWSFGKSIRFAFAAVTAFALSTLAIVRESPDQLLWVATMTLLVLWFLLVFRAIVYAIFPSKFMVHQKKILDALLDSDQVWNLAALPTAAKSAAVSRLEKHQVDQLVAQASWGLALYGGSALWAEKLDQYRKTGASVVFSAIAVVALFAQAVVIFALVNLAIYRIDRAEFVYSDEPNIAVFIRYALSSMFLGEIEALRPAGTTTNWVSVLAGFSCAVIVLVLVVSLIFSWKQTRDDRVAAELIQAMRRKADAYAEKLTGEYGLPLADLLDRVLELGSVLDFLVRKSAHFSTIMHRHTSARGQRFGRDENTPGARPLRQEAVS